MCVRLLLMLFVVHADMMLTRCCNAQTTQTEHVIYRQYTIYSLHVSLSHCEGKCVLDRGVETRLC